MPAEPAAAASPVPSERAVGFVGLRSGTYPVHVHSKCSGAQAFHVAVVQSLSVGAGGTGSIRVPEGYFGRGLCLIAYGNVALSTVVATRAI